MSCPKALEGLLVDEGFFKVELSLSSAAKESAHLLVGYHLRYPNSDSPI